MRSRYFGDLNEHTKKNPTKNKKPLKPSEEIIEDYPYDLDIEKNFLNRAQTA